MMYKMDEIITLNEVQNDGRTIHLYFNNLAGVYTAYGYSAYLLNKEVNANSTYSQSLQMPVVVISASHFDDLTRTLRLVKYEKGYYQFTAETTLDNVEYSKWAKQLRQSAF